MFRYWKPNLNVWFQFEQDKAYFFILAMRRWGLFQQHLLFYDIIIFSSVLLLVYPLSLRFANSSFSETW